MFVYSCYREGFVVGLSVEVGVLEHLLVVDPEGADWLGSALTAASDLVVEDGGAAHSEPTDLPRLVSRAPLLSYPYSDLHRLRRVYAYTMSKPGWEFAPPAPGEDPAQDPVVEEETFMMSSHLLCHSDSEGFYLPVDFADFASGDVVGGMVGSTHRLRSELLTVAPVLGISVADSLSDEEAAKLTESIKGQEGPWVERAVWFSHWEAARLSLEHSTAIVYT